MTHAINLSSEWQSQSELETLAWIEAQTLQNHCHKLTTLLLFEVRSSGDSETSPCVTGPPAACLQTHKVYTWSVLLSIIGVIRQKWLLHIKG